MTNLHEQPPKSDQEPPKSEFVAKLERRWSRGNFVCVGLDSDYSQLPDKFRHHLRGRAQALFNQEIVRVTSDLVCAYKPNIAFYEAVGRDGLRALQDTINFIHADYPDIPVILDAKRADIGNTNLGYIKSAFGELGADAITVHPYLGREALEPFLQQKDKGILVLARTSNPGADEFQGLRVSPEMLYPVDEQNQLGKEKVEQLLDELFGVFAGRTSEGDISLSEAVAWKVSHHWNQNGNCGLVVGATYPRELNYIRRIAGDMPILLPGIGAQGGEVEATVKAGKDSRNQGMVINSSRGIIFASRGEDYAQAARAATQKLHDQINQYRLAA